MELSLQYCQVYAVPSLLKKTTVFQDVPNGFNFAKPFAC